LAISADHMTDLLKNLKCLTELSIACLSTDSRLLLSIRDHPTLKKVALEGFNLTFNTELNIDEKQLIKVYIPFIFVFLFFFYFFLLGAK
jgi:hypothetical protein